MSVAIASITRASSHQRRLAIAEDADAQQQEIIEAARARAFHVDWDRILRNIGDASDSLRAIERALLDEMRSDEFRDTITTLSLDGVMIATLAQMESDRAAGIRKPEPVVAFREGETPDVFRPNAALARWQKIIGLTDEQVENLRDNLDALGKDALPIRTRVTDAVFERIAKLFEDTIAEGLSLTEFKARARDLMPGFTDAMLETEYRTRQAQAYGGALHEQIVSRAAAFPFIQFMALLDSATTWWICRPMGTAGPGGKGYIAATTDGLWFKWRVPVHYRCRSTLSPISYLEAIRMGILKKDGRTKIAIIGSNPDRPYGDPPKFATDPIGGTIRRVEPQEGFGG